MRFLPLIFLLLFAHPSFAQLGNILQERIKKRAAQKAQQRVEQEIDKKVDQTVDEALDEIFNGKNEDTKADQDKKSTNDIASDDEDYSEEEVERAVMEAMLDSAEDSEPVEFTPLETTGSMTMTTNTYTNGKLDKDSPMVIRMTFDHNRIGMRISQGDKPVSQMIHKLEEQKIIVVNNADGKPQAMEMNSKLFMRGARGKKMKDIIGDVDIKKTGNTKTIDGFACEEYIITSEHGVTTSWVTQEAPISSEDMQMVFAKGFNMGQMFEGQDWKDFTGLAIETSSVTRKGKDRTEMKVSEISTKIDSSVFDVSKYDIQKVPGF